MGSITVPTDSAGLAEVLNDRSKLMQFFSAESVADGTTKAFLNAHAAEFLKHDKDAADDLRTQAQAALFDVMREQGIGGSDRRLSGLAGVANGRVALSPEGSALVARGRGAMYNKHAPGAKLEAAIPADDRFHSIGELCTAIRYRNSGSTGPDREPLLRKLALVEQFQNTFVTEDPGSGGFLVPEEMRADLFMVALEKAIVRSHATVIPMNTAAMRVPAVDDTSHVSSVFGGISFAWAEEASQISDSAGTFANVNLVPKKLSGTFTTSNELLADAPAFSGFFDSKAPQALAWFEDKAFMSETGTGLPQGFINCPASVQVATEAGQATQTILWENVTKMYARMLPTSLSSAIWIVSPDSLPQIFTMALSVGTGGGPVYIGGYGNSGGADTPPATILGRPVYVSEKASALGTTGDINFVDLSMYAIGDRSGVQVAMSDQVKFLNDQTVFRLIERVDGRPLLLSALTPANNSSNTLTAFVQLASR